MKYIFKKEVHEEMLNRVNSLNKDTEAQWGIMDVAQMLAHCNVPYEMALTEKYPKAKWFKKWLLTKLLKKVVVGEKPYKKNSRTAPDFVISDERKFEKEKQELLANINKVFDLGESHFEGKQSTSLGNLSKEEWSVMFYKHLNHHLEQFGA